MAATARLLEAVTQTAGCGSGSTMIVPSLPGVSMSSTQNTPAMRDQAEHAEDGGGDQTADEVVARRHDRGERDGADAQQRRAEHDRRVAVALAPHLVTQPARGEQIDQDRTEQEQARPSTV